MIKTELPHEPGCYLFKNKKGIILYIGKAKDLKKRVATYFGRNNLDPKTRVLLKQVDSIDYIITANEKEALILENNLIKQYQPRYNIDLKDSKRYAYLMLTKEDYPRLQLVRRKTKEGIYYGPFVSADKRDGVLGYTRNIFKLRTCRKFPKRECLRYHMENCSAPCIKKVSIREYATQVEDAKKFLNGNNKSLLKDLEKRMKAYAKEREFEKSITLRNRVDALKSLDERQSMETAKVNDQDIVNYMIDDSIVHLIVFNVREGVLSNKKEFEFQTTVDFLEEFTLQYYSSEQIPRELILPEKISSTLVSYLSERRGSKVKVTVPSKGEKKALLDLVKRNVEKSFKEDELLVMDLKEKLGLEKPPNSIECFDVSHLSGTNAVGSMVSFKNGRADKSGYRRFKIKTIEGIDDYAMISEIVYRRYNRLKKEGSVMPDLIVVDGGLGQLSAAQKELNRLKLKIPVISLAKRLEEVYFPQDSSPHRFNRKSRAIRLLQRVRDEAHRFAVSYHKLLRSKKMLGK